MTYVKGALKLMGAGSFRWYFDASYKFIFDLQKIFAEAYEI